MILVTWDEYGTFQKELLVEQIFYLLRIYFGDCFFHDDW